MKIIYRIICLLFLVLVSCNNNDIKEVVIITTNDIHGHIDNFAKLATVVNNYRTHYDNVLLVDAGDRFTGNPYVDFAQKKGEPMVRLMNELNYDVICLGNHAFDYGQSELSFLDSLSTANIICANINNRNVLGNIKPYYQTEIDGIKINFLGLIETSTKNNTPAVSPLKIQGLEFTSFDKMVNEYNFLGENSDAFIALTHLGCSSDSVLTKLMTNLDIIIGGHSHTVIDSENIYNNVLITQTGSYLNNVGIIKLKFKNNKLIDRDYKLIPLNTIASQDKKVLNLLSKIKDNENLRQVVGKVNSDLNIEDLGSFVCDAMANEYNADFAFYNLKGIRLNALTKGDILVKDIFAIEPFENKVVLISLTLKQIKNLLINGYKDDTIIKYFMSKGKYELLDNKGRITINLYDKNNVLLNNDDKIYQVALTDYVISINNDINSPQVFKGLVTTTMIDYLQNNGAVSNEPQRVFISKQQ